MTHRLDPQLHDPLGLDDRGGRAANTSSIDPVGLRQSSLPPVVFGQSAAPTFHWQRRSFQTLKEQRARGIDT